MQEIEICSEINNQKTLYNLNLILYLAQSISIYINMFKFREAFLNFFKSFNVFSSSINLRHEKDPNYDTLAGGITSLGILILLITLSYNVWIGVITKNKVNSSEQISRLPDPTKTTLNKENFMFAFGLFGIDLSDGQNRYFDINLQYSFRDKNRVETFTNIPFQKCNVEDWVQFGQNLRETFQRFQLQKFYCPPTNYSFDLVGKYTSPEFSYIQITLGKCSGIDCRNQSQIDNFYHEQGGYFPNLMYTNTIINPQSLVPTENVFEDRDYWIVTNDLGLETNIYVADYQIETDQSLLPWINTVDDSGIFFDRRQYEQWVYDVKLKSDQKNLTRIYIRKSDKKLQVERSFRKYDDFLSYLGGLFGLFTVFFGAFLNYYSQCELEIQMSKNIFNVQKRQKQNDNDNDKKEEKEKEKEKEENNNNQSQPQDDINFNFFTYLGYLLYQFVKKFGFEPKWRKMIIIQETLDQMRHQLDISAILHKLMFYDKAVHALFDETQLKLLYLQEKYTIGQIKQQRKLAMTVTEFIKLFGKIEGKQYQQTDICLSPVEMTNNAPISSKKRMSCINNEEMFKTLNIRKGRQEDIPDEIKIALRKIHKRMQDGDQVCKRIYEGLKPQLIETFEMIFKEEHHQRKLAPISRFSNLSYFSNQGLFQFIKKQV